MDTLTLLKGYCDALLERQIKGMGPAYDGGFLCPSCKVIHGRSIDAIYGLSVLYKRCRDERYLEAIRALFAYSKNLLCTDGGLYNDLQTEWRYTTVFQEIALGEALLDAGDSLPKDLTDAFRERIALHAGWLYSNLDERSPANINYAATNALALYLAGYILKEERYEKQAKHLADYALDHIAPKSRLFYGESKPHDARSPKGCLGIDIGYNLEESLPSLAKYADLSGDEEAMGKVYETALAHLPFFLPDGAIDDSLGNRNYKWTYYGSRTSDGALPLCLILGKRDPRFLEAGRRNVALIERCTHDGLLYGGPDYRKHGEEPCLHQGFEHMNPLAFAIARDPKDSWRKGHEDLPTDGLLDDYLPEMDSYRLANDGYILDVSGYDFGIASSGHLSGGAITLLFSKKRNAPIIVGSVGDYALTEPTNMQVPLDRGHHRPGYPRIEKRADEALYATGYYGGVSILKDGPRLSFEGRCASREGKALSEVYHCAYELKDDGLSIRIRGGAFTYILPIIQGDVEIIKGRLAKKEGCFFLTPGFMYDEYDIESEGGEIALIIH